MIRELMHDPIFLAGKSEMATKEDSQVACDLLETLIAHKESCVGMAANMIGVRKRIIAFLDESGRAPTYTVMLNPEIIKRDGIFETEEGCLSLLGGPRKCKRYKTIKVQYQTTEMQTRTKTYTGWTAQIIQHEVDKAPPVLRQSTYDGYKRDIEHHIKPYLGDKIITQIMMPDCEKYYDEDMVEQISETNNEKIIEYFADEFEIQAQHDKKYIFVFPYINELLGFLLQRKSQYVDTVLVKAIAHNKSTYEKLRSLIAEAYEALKSDSYWIKDEDSLKEYANEAIAKELDYKENGRLINFRQMFTPNTKSFQIKGMTTNIIFVNKQSNNEVTKHFIDEVNEYYNKIRSLLDNPIITGDLL